MPTTEDPPEDTTGVTVADQLDDTAKAILLEYAKNVI